MAYLQIHASDENLKKFANQVARVGSSQAHVAYARAVNRTVDMMMTRTVRVLVRQTSAPRRAVVASLTKRKASVKGGDLEGAIVATGKPLSLKLFNPREQGTGTVATVWGGQKFYHGAFIKSGWSKRGSSGNAGLGNLTGRRIVLGGHVYERIGKDRTPIEKKYGPSIPEEMVKDASAQSFRTYAPRILDARVRHELGRLLIG